MWNLVSFTMRFVEFRLPTWGSLDMLGIFPPFFKADNFYDFLFVFLPIKLSLKRSTQKGKNLFASKATYFLLFIKEASSEANWSGPTLFAKAGYIRDQGWILFGTHIWLRQIVANGAKKPKILQVHKFLILATCYVLLIAKMKKNRVWNLMSITMQFVEFRLPTWGRYARYFFPAFLRETTFTTSCLYSCQSGSVWKGLLKKERTCSQVRQHIYFI